MTTRDSQPGGGGPPQDQPPVDPARRAPDPYATTQIPQQPADPYAPPSAYGYNPGGPPQPPYEPPVYGGGGYPPYGRRPSPLPWILGGVAALALIGLLAVFLLNNNQQPAPPSPTATEAPSLPSETPFPTSTPLIIVITATPEPPSATVPVTPGGSPTVAGTVTITGTASVTGTATISGTLGPIGLPTVTPIIRGTPGGSATPGGTLTATGSLTATTPTAAPTRTPTPGPATEVEAFPIEPQQGSLAVQYFGHSTFYIVGGEGVRILIDPVPPAVGYRLPFFDPLDAVLLSHWHEDHTYTQVAPGNARNFPGLDPSGAFNPVAEQFNGAAVRSVASFHDDEEGRRLGENAIWVVDVDGFHIVHLGDVGQSELSDAQLAEIGQPDILMIPVGGGETINGGEARDIVAQLEPRLVIPMHYHTDRTPRGLNLADLLDFLGGPPPEEQPNFVRLRKSDLPQSGPEVLVMDYKE